MDANHFLVYLSPLTTALVVIVWWMIRRQINEFSAALADKPSLEKVEQLLSYKIRISEDRSDLTFVLTKVFEPYRMETKETIKDFMILMQTVKKENYEEHTMIKNSISANKDSVIKELQDGLAGIRNELINIRKVASDSMLEVVRERGKNPGSTTLPGK